MMSDEDGKLLFFTNGVSIFNHQNKVIKNGNRINPGPFMEQFGWQIEGLPILQGCLGLSFPNNDSIYQLLHQDMWITKKGDNVFLYSPFYYSSINMKMNGGLGEVITLNKPVNQNDTVSVGQLTACRHANGRDWWVLLKKPYERIYRSYLVTENNVEYKFDNKIQIQTDTFFEPFGQSMFTPDGTKFISVSGPELRKSGYVDIYDFDRCNGDIFNNQRVIFTDSIYGVLGGAVSSNSRFLYVSRYDYILQFDLEASDISASIDTVAKYDGFKSPTSGCPTTFYLSQLAPDGKIYISVGPCAAEYLTIIHDPNKKGKDCNVQQHGLYLEVSGGYIVPNFPNYKLGALKGSGCDTLNIVSNKELLNSYSFKLFPNPASTDIKIDITLKEYDPVIKTEVVIVDVSGAIVQKYTMPDFDSKAFGIATIDISKLASGVYGVQLRTFGGQPKKFGERVLAVEKLVVVR